MADAANQREPQQGSILGTLVRVVVVYVAINAFMGGNANNNKSAVQPAPSAAGLDDLPASIAGGVASSRPAGALRPAPAPAVRLANAFGAGQLMDLRVYITESQEFAEFADTSKLVWEERSLSYTRDDEESSSRALNITLRPSLAVQRNETGMWAHVFLSKAGASPDPGSRTYDVLGTAASHTRLVKIVRRKRPKVTRNLLSGEPGESSGPGAVDGGQGAGAVAKAEGGESVAESVGEGGGESSGSDEAAPDVEWIPHWKPALTISVVEDPSVYPSAASIPPQIAPLLVIHSDAGRYMPVIYINEFWIMADRYIAVNETVSELPLELTFSVTTLMRWMLTEQMQQNLQQQAGLHGEATMDEMRRMFAETSPWLLAVTACVSMLHTIFDMLAFKNDISFWRNNKSMKGLSFRSMIINLFFQTVIFLYLADNDTSYMILVSSGVGLAIEGWKCTKAIKSISFVPRDGSRIPSLLIVPTDSYTLSPTKLYDEEAMRYLSHVMYPLVVGYSAYSLAYDSHKSWSSWLLGSTVNFVYSFGFVLMTPQLFINYKLKSTAHMPWKTFMYKALNTFIDDLFAFIIKMPTMHRLACLRDDFIFVIYLYQRWAYGIDKKRANEYGQVGEDLDENGLPITERQPAADADAGSG